MVQCDGGRPLFDPPFSTKEKIDTYFKLLWLILAGVYYAVAGLFRDRTRDGKGWLRYVVVHLLRYQVNILSLRQRRWIRAPTAEVIAATCRSEKLAHEVIQLNFGSKLHWVGEHSVNIRNVLLYIHGGGFVHPMAKGHLLFVKECRRNLEEGSGEPWSIAFGEYELCPEARYPTQLQQITECLAYLLSQNYSPSNIIVGGDSAGGNLSLGLLSHLIHPHPKINSISLPDALAGIMLLSPAVTEIVSAPSFTTNENHDYLSLGKVKQWTKLLHNDDVSDVYTFPLLGGVDWWKTAPIKKALIVVGGNEMLLDDIVAFSEIFIKAGINTTVITCEGEIHVGCVVDMALGLKPLLMAKTTFAWLQDIWR